MTEFEAYKAELTGHRGLQYRLHFRNSLTFQTAWEPTGDEENPYRFVAGAVFDYKDRFVRRMPQPGG